MTGQPRLPDFVIAGAMRSGTTTVHHVLAQHPEVFLLPGEYSLYSVDDAHEHPPWHHSLTGEWVSHDFDADPQYYLDHHAAVFRDAKPDDLVGVDAPVYLTAARVPERIARHQPDLKIVIVLRDPALRCHSAYWHMVRWGMESRRFEHAVLRDPLLLKRSEYLPPLRRYFELLPRENIHVLRFEDLIDDPRPQVEAILAFLGLATGGLDLDVHANPGRYPRSLTLMRARNRVIGRRWHAVGPAPAEQPPIVWPPRWFTWAERAHNLVNPLVPGTPPAMPRDVHRWLDNHFRHVNRGLSDLVGWDIESGWYQGHQSS